MIMKTWFNLPFSWHIVIISIMLLSLPNMVGMADYTSNADRYSPCCKASVYHSHAVHSRFMLDPDVEPDMDHNTPVSEFQQLLPLVANFGQDTFFVAPNGDDSSGSGSYLDPWRTIAFAVEQVPDGSLILVLPGTYNGRVEISRKFSEGVVIRAAKPYQARLRNDGQVLAIFTGAGITIEGFDIAHSSSPADRYVIQIQDAAGDGIGARDIILRNNVIHDSYNNDLLKVNNGAAEITIEGNIFYNMGGPEIDSHIDINSVTDIYVQDNIFFNDFEGSDRQNDNDTGHFIVVKDSNAGQDGILGSREVIIRRNIFLNWQGNPGNAFIGLGDGTTVDYYHAQDILIENNLMLGNARHKIHAVLKMTSAKNVIFRNNTISGDLPANTYAVRLDVTENLVKNTGFELYNNIWVDPYGTMGAESPEDEPDFSQSPATTLTTFTLLNNAYWNGYQPVPDDPDDLIKYTVDAQAMLVDPKLPVFGEDLLLPRLDIKTGKIAGRYFTIREAFLDYVNRYGVPQLSSQVIDAADAGLVASEDILKHPRPYGGKPDLGAVEVITIANERFDCTHQNGGYGID